MTAALILAGGGARRMGGGDKPLRIVGGQTMLGRVLATLRPHHAHIALSANGDPARFAAFGLPVLPDATAGDGPLAGLLAGLNWAAALGATTLLTLPGDTPFVPPGLAATLGEPPAVAQSCSRTHHLVALWPVGCRDALRDWLAVEGPRQVGRFAATLSPRAVPFAPGPGGDDPFFNINTPADLARAAQMLDATPPARHL